MDTEDAWKAIRAAERGEGPSGVFKLTGPNSLLTPGPPGAPEAHVSGPPMRRKIEVNRDPEAGYADTPDLVRFRIYRENTPSGPEWYLDAVSADGRYSCDVWHHDTFTEAVAAMPAFRDWVNR